MEFQIRYTIEGAGWALLHIEYGTEGHEFSVSYLYDSLSDLSKKTIDLINKSASKVEVIFMDEPGELRLELIRNNNETIQIIGKWSDEWLGELNNLSTEYEMKFNYEVEFKLFAQLVYEILDSIYKEFGVEGYKEKWINHEFPLENYLKIKSFISEN